MQVMFQSLSYRNFRLFYTGQLISFTGSWMQMTAQSWLVYRLTQDPFQLGLVGFLNQIPVLFLSSVGGVLADRVDRQRLIFITQSLAALQAAAMAVLALSGRLEVWHIYVMTITMGSINAFDFPARQAFIGQLVPDSVRHNAIALHAAVVNGSRVIGPALAGFIVAWRGEGACFAINAVSFVAVLTALWMMDAATQEFPEKRKGALREIRSGFRYVARHRAIRLIFTVLSSVSLVGVPFVVLMPIFAQDVLHSGSRGLGILMACSGVGATIGSLYLARRNKAEGIEKIMIKTTVFFGLTLALFAGSTSFLMSCAILLLVGAGMILQLASVNTLLQELSSEQYRGRVMGFYMLILMGIAPFGSMAAGWIASQIGAPYTVAIGGAACMLSGLFFYRRLPRAVVRYRRDLKAGLLAPPIGGRPFQNA
jgi:MFS family permease